MKTPQQHAQEILPLVTAQASGEVIQVYVEQNGKWYDCKEPTAFVDGCKYRIKPKTILVNGFEVPEPMMVKPDDGAVYYIVDPTLEIFANKFVWHDEERESKWLSRGICHTTKEAAIAHAKAMLGINPKDGE